MNSKELINSLIIRYDTLTDEEVNERLAEIRRQLEAERNDPRTPEQIDNDEWQAETKATRASDDPRQG